jgi:hypothetical protein
VLVLGCYGYLDGSDHVRYSYSYYVMVTVIVLLLLLLLLLYYYCYNYYMVIVIVGAPHCSHGRHYLRRGRGAPPRAHGGGLPALTVDGYSHPGGGERGGRGGVRGKMASWIHSLC